MFVRIKHTKHFSKTLRYHELKVADKKAELIYAENFASNTAELGQNEIKERFIHRFMRNERVERNTLQINISFAPSDTVDNEKLTAISRWYMKAMNIGEEPYLVYRHKDTASPHLHIVAAAIRQDGEPIEIRKADCRLSMELTRQLEHAYKLKQQPSIKEYETNSFETTHAHRVEYGKNSLKHAISDVLNTVVDRFQYTSLAELNAVLRVYNVQADRGCESSRLFQQRGLVYHALDKEGKKVGKSIKASLFQLKPTLDKLEKNFATNLTLRQEQRSFIPTCVRWALKNSNSWPEFRRKLADDKIRAVIQDETKEGPKDIYFIDFERKCVFKGKGLGEEFGLEALQNRIREAEERHRQDMAEEGLTHRHRLHL